MIIRTTTAMGNLFSCNGLLKNRPSRPYEFSQQAPNHDYSFYDPVTDMRDDKDHKCDDEHTEHAHASLRSYLPIRKDQYHYIQYYLSQYYYLVLRKIPETAFLRLQNRPFYDSRTDRQEVLHIDKIWLPKSLAFSLDQPGNHLQLTKHPVDLLITAADGLHDLVDGVDDINTALFIHPVVSGR